MQHESCAGARHAIALLSAYMGRLMAFLHENMLGPGMWSLHRSLLSCYERNVDQEHHQCQSCYWALLVTDHLERLHSHAFPSGLQIARKESELAKEKEHLVELQRQEAAAKEAQQGVQKELAKQVGLRACRQRRASTHCKGAVL